MEEDIHMDHRRIDDTLDSNASILKSKHPAMLRSHVACATLIPSRI